MGPPPRDAGRSVFSASNRSHSPGPVYALESSFSFKPSDPVPKFGTGPRFESTKRWYSMKIAKRANFGVHSPGPLYMVPSDFNSKKKPRPKTAKPPNRFGSGGYIKKSASPGPIYALPGFGSDVKPIRFGAGPRFLRNPADSASPGPVYQPYSDFGPAPEIPESHYLTRPKTCVSPGPRDARHVAPRNWCTSPKKLAMRKLLKQTRGRPGTSHGISTSTVSPLKRSASSPDTRHGAGMRRRPASSGPTSRSRSRGGASSADPASPPNPFRSALFPYLNAHEAGVPISPIKKPAHRS